MMRGRIPRVNPDPGRADPSASAAQGLDAAVASRRTGGPMPRIALHVNGEARTVEVDDPSEPLLYVLRNALGLTGAKYGCGLGQCGACTVLVDGEPVRSCVLPVSRAADRKVTTDRGPGHAGEAASAAGGVRHRAGGAMRLLRHRHGDDGRGAARQEAQRDAGGSEGGARGQPLPLRHPPAHSATR